MVDRQGAVEDVVIEPDFWRGRRVFLTGHTGFKGGWTALVLRSLGAEVTGFALAPEQPDGIFSAAHVVEDVEHKIGDIRDARTLDAAISEAQPEIVIHMAAQSLVRASYLEPVATYATNVMGTVHVLEAARHSPSMRAVVVVTSDKCYENLGHGRPYKEGEPLGGHDPYSNSKACAELVTDAYRRSFFTKAATGNVLAVASARAGNVIGGGDWAHDRLVPDAMRAFRARQPLRIRNPGHIRPWQHVLDPVLGYLLLAEHLVRRGAETQGAWNFGPSAASEVPVSVIVENLVRLWGGDARWERDGGEHPYEAPALKLDAAKASEQLKWRPVLGLQDALSATMTWYRAQHEGRDMRKVTLEQIEGVMTANLTGSAALPSSHGLAGAARAHVMNEA